LLYVTGELAAGLEDERIVEAWFFPDNQAAADRFFGGTPAADFLA
jgi:hypothetical protein